MIELIPLLNREGKFQQPADGWFQLAPIGEFDHAESGLRQLIDQTAVAAMVNSFAGEALLDFDHFSYDPEKSSEAAGWITELQARETGLWGRVRWTDIGEAAVSNGRYRYVSPVWLRADVEALDGSRVRPLRLDSAGLTNQPNLRGMAPLSNRAASGAPNQNKPTLTNMQSIAKRLGLAPGASEASVLSEIEKLINRADTAETQLAPITAERDMLKNRVDSLLEIQVESDLDKYGITDEAARKSWKPLLLLNRDSAIVALAAVKPTEERKDETATITNRQTAKVPAGSKGSAANLEEDAATAKKIANRAAEIQRTQGVPFTTAWQRAKGEFVG